MNSITISFGVVRYVRGRVVWAGALMQQPLHYIFYQNTIIILIKLSI